MVSKPVQFLNQLAHDEILANAFFKPFGKPQRLRFVASCQASTVSNTVRSVKTKTRWEPRIGASLPPETQDAAQLKPKLPLRSKKVSSHAPPRLSPKMDQGDEPRDTFAQEDHQVCRSLAPCSLRP